jgi:hypothetical protein
MASAAACCSRSAAVRVSAAWRNVSQERLHRRGEHVDLLRGVLEAGRGLEFLVGEHGTIDPDLDHQTARLFRGFGGDGDGLAHGARGDVAGILVKEDAHGSAPNGGCWGTATR